MTQIFSDYVDAPPFRSGLWLNPVVHELWYQLRLIWLRDRLRCPHCKAVGTWKPHGTRRDRREFGDRPVRRWMCKCCGLYQGPEGVRFAFPDPVKGCWVLREPGVEPSPTPRQMLDAAKAWPWYG